MQTSVCIDNEQIGCTLVDNAPTGMLLILGSADRGWKTIGREPPRSGVAPTLPYLVVAARMSQESPVRLRLDERDTIGHEHIAVEVSHHPENAYMRSPALSAGPSTLTL
jgi:hypothetical protein